MTAETVDPKDWWDEIDLGFGEVILMGCGPSTPGVGGPNNLTSICYFDGRVLAPDTGLVGHGRLPSEDIPDGSYAETRGFHWDKDYCLEHLRIPGVNA